MKSPARFPLLCLSATVLLLGGCDAVTSTLGLETAKLKAAKLEAESKAVGAACRQSGRALEDCYSLYNWLSVDHIYAGWMSMDEYMRENKLETVKPDLPPMREPLPAKKKKATAQPAANPAPEGASAPLSPLASPTTSPDASSSSGAPSSPQGPAS
ncbi:MAG: hypothetical protein LBL69_06785 [Zoogloeaceae bacterium]|jgi:hypothetical protein|nr:hypothetical protein [Zoogloeaceae bacterium]